LMMNSETPPATGSLSPRKRSQSRPVQDKRAEMEEGANLFYAYALRVSGSCMVSSPGQERHTNLCFRATILHLLRTFSLSPRPPSARNGGVLFSTNTRRRRGRVRNTSWSGARIWSS
jgi:hypothetical protein